MKEKLLEKIESLNEIEKYQEIIDLIEALPSEQVDTELIGLLRRDCNDIEKYEDILMRLIEVGKEKQNTVLWNFRVAYSYYFLKNFSCAEYYFLKAYELEPENKEKRDFLAETYIVLTRIEDKKENKEKALEYYLKALEFKEDDVYVMSNIDGVFNFTDVSEEGIRYFQEEEAYKNVDNSVNKKINCILTFYSGYYLIKEKKYEEAIEKFKQVLELEERDEIRPEYVYEKIGWCKRNLGKYEEALADFYQAEKLRKNIESINTEIAISLAKIGKLKEATERFEKSLNMLEEEDIKKRIFINSQLASLYGKLEEIQLEKTLKYLKIAKELGRKDKWINSEIEFQLRKSFKIKKNLYNIFKV